MEKWIECQKPAFSPFHRMFSTHPKIDFQFLVTINVINAKPFNFQRSNTISCHTELTLPRDKLKDFSDDKVKFDENSKKTYRRVVKQSGEKGEIAQDGQFLLFPWCFQKDLYSRHVKTQDVCKRVKLQV